MQRLTVLVICCVLACLISGCIFGDDDRNDSNIFGVWDSMRGASSNLILRSNYSCTGGGQLIGRYEINGDEITFIEIQSGEERKRMTYKYLLFGDYLTLYEIKTSELHGNYNNYQYEYKRVK